MKSININLTLHDEDFQSLEKLRLLVNEKYDTNWNVEDFVSIIVRNHVSDDLKAFKKNR